MLQTQAKQSNNRSNIKVKELFPPTGKRGPGRSSKPMGRKNPPCPGARPVEDPRVQRACGQLADLPARLAMRFARRLPAHVELDDLVSAGSVGLVIAVKQHIDKPDLDLARLAKQRIRGAILDYLRSVDPLTRRQRAAVSAFNRVRHNLRQQGQGEEIGQVARGLGVSVERAERIRSQLASVQVGSLDDAEQLATAWQNPLEGALDAEDGSHLRQALGRLPGRLQTILSLYYVESLTYKEIGDLLKISRSRICQLHTQAVEELRRLMIKQQAA